MKVKKFVAASMPEIMKQIRAELGVDAVILNSKEIYQGGFLGLFKKRKIEVIAALDPQPVAPSKQTREIIDKEPVFEQPLTKESSSNVEVLNEIKYLKKILEQQAKQSDKGYLPDYQLAYQYLLDQEVEESLAKELIESVISEQKNNNQLVSADSILVSLQKEIENRLTGLSFEGITYDQKIIQFAGPTGVGKTTTLAKVAANCVLVDHKKVAFITTDTYRIAAIEQLKTYARILDVPVEVAYTIEDYHEAIHKLSAYDVILVDTAGRNFRNEKYIQELRKSIDLNTKTYLVLSLTSKPNDMIDIYKQFQHLFIKEVIFTKLDETLQYGSMINILLQNQVGVAYLTNGQDVPDDLVKPSPKIVTDYILGRYLNE